MAQGGIVGGVLLLPRGAGLVGLIRNIGHGRMVVGNIGHGKRMVVVHLVGWMSTRNAHECPLNRGYSHPQTCTPLHGGACPCPLREGVERVEEGRRGGIEDGGGVACLLGGVSRFGVGGLLVLV
jgi:hypothetical protein